jgi:protein-S-isoprenylcysteine O-methyltransferase Ste14
MQTVLYTASAGLLIAFAYLVFHRVVAKDYLKKSRLGWQASILQLLVFVTFFSFPYLYMPSSWAWDWLPNGTWNRLAALALTALGMIAAFGTMAWFGLRRAFGLQVQGIITTGPYRYSRNPQMVGGWLMVLGVFVYLPSLYNLGWVLIWAVIGHWMVTQEETHLLRVFGEAYKNYCDQTPRYLLLR